VARHRVTSLAVKVPFFNRGAGKPTPPVARKAAKVPLTLSAQERLQELLEERRMQKGWRERKAPPKGFGGA